MSSTAIEIASAMCRPAAKRPSIPISDPNSATPILLPVCRIVVSVPEATAGQDRAGGSDAVDDVSAQEARGQIAAVIGRNASPV